MHDPGQGHWQALKWILHYLLKTVDVGSVFERDDTCNKYAIDYVDSYYADDFDKWCPQQVMCLLLQEN